MTVLRKGFSDGSSRMRVDTRKGITVKKAFHVTLADIARKLDVSTVTVSKALRGHPDISEETVRKIKKLAREMGYTPNRIASSLSSRKSNTIGVIIPKVAHFFFSSVYPVGTGTAAILPNIALEQKSYCFWVQSIKPTSTDPETCSVGAVPDSPPPLLTRSARKSNLRSDTHFKLVMLLFHSSPRDASLAAFPRRRV